MIRLFAAFSLASLLCATAAQADEICLSGHYRLPEPIAEDIRPYLICVLFQERSGHFGTRINGRSASITGSVAHSCDSLRRSAMAASEARLALSIADTDERRSFIASEFEKLDRFLRIAARSDDLGVGEEPVATPCGIASAQDQ